MAIQRERSLLEQCIVFAEEYMKDQDRDPNRQHKHIPTPILAMLALKRASEELNISPESIQGIALVKWLEDKGYLSKSA